MPTPDTKQNYSPEDRRRIESMFRPPADLDLANEVAALRQEIALLRAELAPVPSLIITGRQALDEFKRLAGNG